MTMCLFRFRTFLYEFFDLLELTNIRAISGFVPVVFNVKHMIFCVYLGFFPWRLRFLRWHFIIATTWPDLRLPLFIYKGFLFRLEGSWVPEGAFFRSRSIFVNLRLCSASLKFGPCSGSGCFFGGFQKAGGVDVFTTRRTLVWCGFSVPTRSSVLLLRLVGRSSRGTFGRLFSACFISLYHFVSLCLESGRRVRRLTLSVFVGL